MHHTFPISLELLAIPMGPTALTDHMLLLKYVHDPYSETVLLNEIVIYPDKLQLVRNIEYNS